MVIWVCGALEVNNLTVLAVGLNHLDKDDSKDNKIASSGSDPPVRVRQRFASLYKLL